MEVRTLFGCFVWRGVNIDDVTIHPSWGPRINPTLNVCEHNRVAHASYDMTDIAGENAEGCSWYTTLKILKGGERSLATHKSWGIASWHRLHFLFPRPISLHSPSINYKIYPVESFTLPPLIKCLVVGKLNLITFKSLWECGKP